MQQLHWVNDLPRTPAVYAMYGGKGRNLHVAYVGVADSLKTRIQQHLVRRDSSVATGTSDATLNPDYVTRVDWWEHPDFADRSTLEAAELVAFDVLEPALRSRGGIRAESKRLHEDETFSTKMRDMFSSPPAGQLHMVTLEDAFARIDELEQRIAALERQLSGQNSI